MILIDNFLALNGLNKNHIIHKFKLNTNMQLKIIINFYSISAIILRIIKITNIIGPFINRVTDYWFEYLA